MAHVYHEGFDNIVTAEIADYFPTTGGSGQISTANARHGAGDSNFLISTRPVALRISTAEGIATPRDEWFVGFAYRPVEFGAHIMRTYEGGLTTEHVRLTSDSLGHLVVSRAGTVLATGAVVMNTGTWYYIELRFKVHDTTGLVHLRVNGADDIALTTSLDTRNAGAAGLVNYFLFGLAGSSSVGGDYGRFDDIYINDATGSSPHNGFYGDCRVEGIAPSGNGNSSALTGSDGNSTDNYLHVDDQAGQDGDTSYVGGTTGKDTYAMENLTSAGVVRAVSVQALGRKTGTASRTLNTTIRSGTTEVDGTALGLSLGGTYAPTVRQTTTTNPDTGTDWTTEAAVNALEMGVEIG